MKKITAVVVRVEIETTNQLGQVVKREHTQEIPIFESELGDDLWKKIKGKINLGEEVPDAGPGT